MSSEKSNSLKKCVLSGVIGAFVIALILIIYLAYWAPIDYSPIYMLNPEKAMSYESSAVIDSVKCVHTEVLKDLESKGLLLTPAEYTSHVANYYNIIITFLIGLFVIFTFVTMYSINYVSKKEIEEIKADIDNHKTNTKNELKENIIDSLNELMRDSISFKDSCIDALYGRIEDEILSKNDKDIIDNRINKIEQDMKHISELCYNKEEDKLSKQEIQ